MTKECMSQMMKLKTPLYWMRGVLLALLVLAGMPQQVLAQMTVTYFHNEISGSAVAASDSAGRVVWKENYRPYGERQVKAAGSESNGVWFAGKPQEARSGLVYMGARYYDPVAGRFMGVDPLGWQEDNLHSFNRYAYANNNPYRYVDPDGRIALPVLLLTGAVVLYIGATQYTYNPQAREAADRLGREISRIFSTAADGDQGEVGADNKPTIHEGQQGKHVPGHNNFQPGKSELTDPDPQGLLDQGAGTGQQVGNVPLGQPGSKERVDFGKNIGTYVDPVTGQRSPTNIGIIHNGSRGSHIVPARPGP